MNEYEIHELLLKHICKEIADIAENVEKNGNISEQELKRLDILYHTKKDMLACHGMEHPEEYGNGSSGMRGRSPMTGRYVSRESYEDGYSKGYSEAMNQMNQGNSGHWPQQNPYYPEPRRW